MFTKRFNMMLASVFLFAVLSILFMTQSAYAQAIVTDQNGNTYWFATDEYGNSYVDQYGNQCLLDINGYVYAINAYTQLYVVDSLGCYTHWRNSDYSVGGYYDDSGSSYPDHYSDSYDESADDGWNEWYAEQRDWHNSWGDWYSEQADYSTYHGDYASADYYSSSAASSYDNGSYYDSYSSDDE